MTKTEMLERKIADGGFNVTDLARALGIPENTLVRKICGEEEFLVSELWAVGEILDLKEAEMQEIFLKSL